MTIKILTMVTFLLMTPLANAQPICTPNLTPEQAFLAIKNQNFPNSTANNPSSTMSFNNPNSPPPTAPTLPLQPNPTLLNINTATEAELVQLNGISGKKAQDIILYREMIAPFRTVDELDNVKGIGKATIEKNRAIITVGDGQTVAR